MEGDKRFGLCVVYSNENINTYAQTELVYKKNVHCAYSTDYENHDNCRSDDNLGYHGLSFLQEWVYQRVHHLENGHALILNE